jgi:uncharacterized protein (TIGR00106 family)
MEATKDYCVIAEFSIHPVGQGTSLSKYVKSALNELRKVKGVRLMVTPMGTVLEARRLPEILEAVRVANEALFREGAKRVYFVLKVDDRRDKERRMEDKVAAVTG